MNLGDMAAIVSRLHLALEVPSKEFLDENLQIAYVEAGSIWLGIISSPLVYLVLVQIFNLYKLYSQHRINMEAAARKLTAQSTINSYLDYIKNNVGMQLQLLAESEADEIMEIQERRNKISDRSREERRDKIRTRLISSVGSLHDLLKDGVELHSMLDGSPYENSPFKLKYEKNQSEDLDRKNPILQPYSSHKGESFPVADNDTAEQLMPIRAKKEPE
jgi:hypothetical protein